MSDHVMPEGHRRAVEALRYGGPPTPGGGGGRLPALEPPSPPRPLGGPRGVPRLLAPAAGVAALIVVAVVVVLSLGGPAGPSVVQASELAQLPSTQPTPARDPHNATLLDRRLEGVSFPDWSKEFGWRADGARTDRLDGRRAETVFYTHHGHRVGYTVISGKPLEMPDDAQVVRRNGLEMLRYMDGDRTVLVFERNGLTCILAGHVVHENTPFKLASWRAGGATRL